MPPTTLEFDVPSTAQAVGRYNQWISTKTVRVRRTGRPKYARFVRLSRFDLAVNEGLDRLASLERNWDAEGADPIEPAIIAAARELISALPRHLKRPLLIPAVVPMCKGNLQFGGSSFVKGVVAERKNRRLWQLCQYFGNHPSTVKIPVHGLNNKLRGGDV